MEPFTLMLLASAGLGALQGAKSARQREADEKYRKAVITYRPWTGLQDPGASQEQGDALSGAVSGGLTGAMLGKGVGLSGAEGLFGGAGEAAPAADAGSAGALPGLNYTSPNVGSLGKSSNFDELLAQQQAQQAMYGLPGYSLASAYGPTRPMPYTSLMGR